MAREKKFSDIIASLYYSHGLFCASYPGTVIAFVSLTIVVCSLPFFITGSGDFNTPKPWRSPWLNYRVPAGLPGTDRDSPEWIINDATQFSKRTPSWFVGLPLAVIQQLYITVELDCSASGQLCQKSYYSTSRAAAAHLLERLKEAISVCQPTIHPAALNFTHSLWASTHSEPRPHPPHMGVLSPVLDSINNWEESQDSLGYQSMEELLYGGFWAHEHLPFTGGRSRSLTFALTFMLQASRHGFGSVTGCLQALGTTWPDHTHKHMNWVKHFYYESPWHVLDFAPLLGVYCIVFLYITFSVSKIDLVKSKFWMGVAACVNIIGSLTMSLGICTFFGLSISLSGSEIYPFVVVVMGLENTLIIVKAVMSTPVELEVKHRIAMGMSKEGWAISRNLATLLFMLAMGIVFFNYTMKEFCIIALVGLLCDAFLQLCFFPTVLSVDIRRMELADLNAVSVTAQHTGEGTPSAMERRRCPIYMVPPRKWDSRRLKFAYFLASARFMSKALMVGICAYLLGWFSHSEMCYRMLGLRMDMPTVAPPTQQPLDPALHPGFGYRGSEADLRYRSGPALELDQTARHWQPLLDEAGLKIEVFRSGEEGWGVECEGGEVCWRPMVTTHWPKLLHHYGYNTEERFLTVLPPITLTLHLGTQATRHTPSPPNILEALFAFFTAPNAGRVIVLVTWLATLSLYSALLIHSTLKRHRMHQRKDRHSLHRIVCLKGHVQDVECLAVERGLVVSASLDGDIRVWDPDPMRRRCLLVITRSEICGVVPEGMSRPAVEGCENDEESQSAVKLPPPGGKVPSKTPAPPQGEEKPGTEPPRLPNPPYGAIPASNQQPTGVGVSQPHPLRPAPPPPPYAPNIHRRRASETMATLSSYHRGQSVPPSPNPGQPPLVFGSRSQSTHSLQEGAGVLRRMPSGTSLASASGSVMSLQGSTSTTSLHRQPSTTSLHGQPSTTSLHGQPSTMSLQGQSSPTNLQGAPNLPRPPSAASLLGLPGTASLPGLPGTASLPGPLSMAGLPRAPALQPPNSSSLHGNILAVSSSPPPTMYMSPSRTSTHAVVVTVPAHPPSVSFPPPSEPQLRSRRSAADTGIRVSAPAHNTASTQSMNASTRPPIELQFSQTYTEPLSSTHTDPSPGRPPRSRPGHSRNSSLTNICRPSHSRNSSYGNISLGNLSLMSNASGSALSLNTSFVFDKAASQPPSGQAEGSGNTCPQPQAEQTEGYNFARYFDLFSPFNYHMALQYNCVQRTEDLPAEYAAPPIWCLGCRDQVVAVGCGNGQIESWNLTTGSLTFCLSMSLAGVTTIAVTSSGIVTGHMDGFLHLIGHNGLPQHSIQAHSKPVSVLVCHGDVVITGGYDTEVKVHRIRDFFCLQSVHIHTGSISAITTLEPKACVSGCSKGLVCSWELSSGKCLQEFEEYGSAVVKLADVAGYLVALFADHCLRVWEADSGDLLHTVSLEGVCNDFAVLGARHIAVSLECAIVIYDVESGKKHSRKEPESQNRGMALIRHILPLDSAHIICSIGRDIQLIPCGLKLKAD